MDLEQPKTHGVLKLNLEADYTSLQRRTVIRDSALIVLALLLVALKFVR